MADKVYNFKPGPATLPAPVMQKAQEEFTDFRNLGYGIVEESHRSKDFAEVHERAKSNIRELLGIGDNYSVLFLQGGASLQFVMVPMNIMLQGKPACYADTGSWSNKAVKEAKNLGDVKLVYSGEDKNYTEIGDPSEWSFPADASYGYICSNNTIFGTQFRSFPDTGDVPLVADMSSDIMSRRVNVDDFGIIFAGAQKNLGPAGVTLVIIRNDLAERTPSSVPTMLDYNTHIDKDSMFNTPCTFGIYMIGLVTDWIKEKGGLEEVERVNQAKSSSLYEYIDSSDFYNGTAEPADRSQMNVTFRLPSEELEKQFLKESEAAGLLGLKGHRSVGGCRASIYNAMPLEGVEKLIDFMSHFEQRNS